MTLKLHPALSHFPIGFPIAAFVLSGPNLFGVIAVDIGLVALIVGTLLVAIAGFWIQSWEWHEQTK